ncbi:hypothetical protein PHYSODRAFT_297225 [Phytophthora sojae]|uniref:Uncharacterized protein n=1 Tax=Phytophthora sojae (strain P6497) TaxID=1094619 RepID=G4YX60_PHYSP|nr:hypothetical protein PHYSODRAFT_297225 [Phytophthora sojae]EGZ25628.1 hypothetical protein PHYSODRAFT_297225 [Phytophthora sojae]|eukprot:XP_009520916.1 hypothetical protein PHYSODRAFT_297225 [Phytophthora sojae]
MPKRSNSSSGRTHDGTKRRLTSSPQDQQDEQPPPCPYPRLEAAHFPPEILAIPHVLKRIDIFLMTKDEAVMEASKTGDAEWLEDLAEEVDDDIIADAIVEASTHGHVDCVEMLMEDRNEWSPGGSDSHSMAELCSTLHGALLDAAEGGFLDVVKFVVLQAKAQEHRYYDTLFPVLSFWDPVNMVSFLLDKKRASSKSVNSAFVKVRSTDVLKLLLDREYILDESICAVFERETRSLDEHWDYSKEEEGIRIIKLLHTKNCIPAEMISKAFMTAALKGQYVLLALLRGDGRISAGMVGEAFAAAATRKESDLMMSLYDANISADAILVAFSNAAAGGRMKNVKELVKLLSDRDRVPQELSTRLL